MMHWFDKNFIFVDTKGKKFMCFRNPHRQVALKKHAHIKTVLDVNPDNNNKSYISPGVHASKLR